MIYLPKFRIPTAEEEARFISNAYKFNMSCYSSYYPFHIFEIRDVPEFNFSEITMLYGSNGSGKTTILNLIANSIKAHRISPYNTTDSFDDYVGLCHYSRNFIDHNYESIVISSDDIFQEILGRREANNRLDKQRAKNSDEYFYRRTMLAEQEMPRSSTGYSNSNNHRRINLESKESIQEFYTNYEARKRTASQFIKQRMAEKNIITQSNGEYAYNYYVSKIKQGNLYLIDEPENSLSSPWLKELMTHIQIMARYEECQFIIATHSPFVLSMPNSKIYDLDNNPVEVRKWTELENMRMFYDLFKEYKSDFEL